MLPRIGQTFLNGINSFKNYFPRGMDKWVGFRVAKKEGKARGNEYIKTGNWS
jgi:hypothetical protein